MKFSTEYLYIVVHFAALLLTSKGETCTYERTVGMKGNQIQWKGFQSATADTTACEQFCTSSTNSVAAEYHNGSSECYLYEILTNLTPAPDVTYLNKTCVEETTVEPTTETTPTTTTDFCSMRYSPNSISTDKAFLVMTLNSDSCKKTCVYITDCRAAIFTGVKCNLYSQATSTSSSIAYIKQACNNGKLCCMSQSYTHSGTKLLMSLSASASDCEYACLLVTDCMASTYIDNSCSLFTTNITIDNVNSMQRHSVKSCQPGQPNGLSTLARACQDGAQSSSPTILLDTLAFTLSYPVLSGVTFLLSFWKS